MTYSRENKYWHWSAFCQEIDAERAYHTNSFQTLVFIHVIQRHAKKSKQISVFTQKLGSLSIQIFVLADLVLIDEKVCFFLSPLYHRRSSQPPCGKNTNWFGLQTYFWTYKCSCQQCWGHLRERNIIFLFKLVRTISSSHKTNYI